MLDVREEGQWFDSVIEMKCSSQILRIGAVNGQQSLVIGEEKNIEHRTHNIER